MGCAKKDMVKSTSTISSDRISSLPREIKGYILSLLNVQDAVRTSVLSSAWRNMWITMPHMFLSDTYSSCGSSEGSQTNGRSKFITLVDMALSFHEGPLVSFSIEGNQSYHDVFDRWMYMLSKSEALDITIELISNRKYKIPSSLFSISILEHLYLDNCIIRLPRVFEGFKSLTVLKLNYFSSTDSDISNLISSCRMLRTLCLIHFENINCLSIQAPVLEYLEVEGNFEDLHLHAPNLADAYITLEKSPVARDGKCYVKQAFGSLSDIKTLTVSGSFLTYLSKGRMRTKLPGAFHHLEKICIEICCFWNWTEVLAARLLFQNAPVLRELDLWSYHYPEAFGRKRTWDQNQREIEKPTLDHLVTVTFHEFMGYDCEVAFIGMLLSWTPALEVLKIVRKELNTVGVDGNGNCMCKILTDLLALPRASGKARIIVT